MKITKSAKYSFAGTKISVEDLNDIVLAARSAGVEEVSIVQYRSSGDYGGTTTDTYISFEEVS